MSFKMEAILALSLKVICILMEMHSVYYAAIIFGITSKFHIQSQRYEMYSK